MNAAPRGLEVDALVRRAAIGLAAVAFAGSWLHVVTFAAAKGQHWLLAAAIATMPEVSVAVCILVLRSAPAWPRRIWAAIVLATSVAFTVRANLGVTIPSDWTAIMVAVWPAWAAIGAAGLVEAPRHKPATRPATRPATAPASPAPVAAAKPATRPATTGPVAVATGVRDLPIPEQLDWFRRELPLHPERTSEQWAAITGLSLRTVERRKEQLPAEQPREALAAGGAR